MLRFDGLTNGSQAAPFGPALVGTITFRADNPAGNASDIDITPGLFEPAIDAFFDGTTPIGLDVSNSVVFQGASITPAAVPEPGAMAMLLFATVGGAYIRMRKAKIAARSIAES